jgi:hypothetical protein
MGVRMLHSFNSPGKYGELGSKVVQIVAVMDRQEGVRKNLEKADFARVSTPRGRTNHACDEPVAR